MKKLFLIGVAIALLGAGCGVGAPFVGREEDFLKDEAKLNRSFSGRAAQIEVKCRDKKNTKPDELLSFVPGSVEFIFRKGLSEADIKEYLTENNFPQDYSTLGGIGYVRVPTGREDCWIQELKNHPEIEDAFQTLKLTTN